MRYEKFNFSDDFQDALISCLVGKSDKFGPIADIVQPEFFNGSESVEVVFALKEFFEKYGHYPNFTTLGNYVFHRVEQLSPERASTLEQYVVKLADVDTTDWEYLRDYAIRFCKERAIYHAIKRIGLAQAENKPVDPVVVMENAVRIGDDIADDGLEIGLDGERVIREATNRNSGVFTGYHLLDEVWRSGWAPGWLITVLAPPKRFKTTFCVNMAINMARLSAGNDVLYYACEISQSLACMRAIYNMTSLTENDLFEMGADKFVKRFKKEWRLTMKSRVWFKHYAAKTANVSMIKRHAKSVIDRYGITPRAIFIDYAETIRPNSTAKNTPDHRASADVYTDARALAEDIGCAVIMPDRCNRETVGKKVPSMNSFQGSFEKAGIVDAAIGLCATGREHKQNKIRAFVFLNRHGPQYQHFEGKVDPERYQIALTGHGDDVDPDDNEDDGVDLDGSGGGKKRRGGRGPRTKNARLVSSSDLRDDHLGDSLTEKDK